MSSDERWAKATAAVEQIEEVESVRRDPSGAQADLAALRRAAVRITGCDVDADLSVLLAGLALLPSFEDRVGIVQVLRDAAGGALSPGDTVAVLAVLSRSVPASEGASDANAPVNELRLTLEGMHGLIADHLFDALHDAIRKVENTASTAPLAQALDLLRRTRGVLHKLDPAHEKLGAEIDALLAGAPVVESRRPTEDVKATLLSAVRTAHDGEQGRRDHLGRIVREEWIKWAREQPSPKPSWLVPWEGLSEPDKEVDRRIGARLYSIGVLSTAGEPQIAPTAYHPEIEAAIDGVVSATKGVGPSPFERAVVRLLGMLSKHREGLRAPLTEEEARRLAREIGDLCHNPDVNELDTWTRTLLAVDRGETPPEVRPVAPFTEDDARHSLGAALREAAKRSVPVAPPTPDLDTRPSFVQSMRDAGYKPLPSPLRIVCREFDDLHECALDINHEGDHNTAADGSGDSFPNFAPDLAALCARRDRLRARFASYNGGDRPMSPPVALIRELAEVEAQIEAAKDATPDAPHTHPLSPEDEARGFRPRVDGRQAAHNGRAE